MKDAIAAHVQDGDTVVIEGFTHLICFAAGHEIIRQRRKDLTSARLTPDLIYDQMIAAGCARKLVFSWAGNPGRRIAARLPPRGGEGYAAARDRGVQSLRDGGADVRRRRAPPLLGDAQLHGDRSAQGQPADPHRDLPLHRRIACDGARPQSRRDDHPRPARRSAATRRSGACSACRRRPRSHRSGSSSWWRSWWTSR